MKVACFYQANFADGQDEVSGQNSHCTCSHSGILNSKPCFQLKQESRVHYDPCCGNHVYPSTVTGDISHIAVQLTIRSPHYRAVLLLQSHLSTQNVNPKPIRRLFSCVDASTAKLYPDVV